MEQLFELQQLLLSNFSEQVFFQRHAFQGIALDNRVTGILGCRGVGKTSWLLHTVLTKNQAHTNALYVSADHVYFLTHSLLDLADRLIKETDVRLLCIDEIHKYPNWQQEIKNIADFYLDLKLIFTGSSMIDIVHSKFDLSRRVSLFKLHGLSFREYLAFYHDIKLPLLELEQLITDHLQICQQLPKQQLLKLFHTYLQHGYFPFAKQFSQTTMFYQALENVVQKTIYEDIASLHNLKTPSLLVIEKLYKYVINSQAGELNAYKLAKTLNKDFTNITSYLHYLIEAGLILPLYKKQSGKAHLRNPIKLYPENSNFIYASLLPMAQDMLIGKARETFALNQLHNARLPVYYSEHGDITVHDIVFEIGGKNKTYKQLKQQDHAYILADGILIGNKQRIPLFLLGLLN